MNNYQVNKERYDNPTDAIRSVQVFVEQNTPLENEWILEAGCGSLSRLKIPGKARLCGIDISQKQLDRNEQLHEKICGDLQQQPLPTGRFRLCICWDVIEHIERPDDALKNLCNSLQKNGYLILALPNVRSLKGLVTRFSPHWFHVWYYRTILGIKNAGEHDTAPFVTFLRGTICAEQIMAKLVAGGFVIEKLIYRDAMVYRLRQSHYALWLLYSAISSLVWLITAGRFGGSSNSDYIVIARKG